jgi:CBS domain-containing protein
MGSIVKDVMTTQVVAVGTAASFKEMVVTMRKSRVSALPVVDGEGRVIGVVSEADMLNMEAGLAADDLAGDVDQEVSKGPGLRAFGTQTPPVHARHDDVEEAWPRSRVWSTRRGPVVR